MKRRLLALSATAVMLCCIVSALAQGGGAGASVTIKNVVFEPNTITVKPGTTVTWTNTAGAHTVTADNGSFDSGTLSQGQTFSRKFTRKGTYRYFCSFHGSKGGHDMSGVVVVK